MVISGVSLSLPDKSLAYTYTLCVPTSKSSTSYSMVNSVSPSASSLRTRLPSIYIET